MSASGISTYAAGSGGFTMRINGAVVGQNPNARVLSGDEYPCTIVQSTSGEHTMSFTIEDKTGSAIKPVLGDIVTLLDPDGFLLYKGHLIRVVIRKMPVSGRYLDCECVGMDRWLDWRIIPRTKFGRNTAGFINTMNRDKDMVETLINRFGGGELFTSNRLGENDPVQSTNNSMGDVGILGLTLREAIERIGETASTRSDTSTRSFFVDIEGRLYYYQDRRTDKAAPWIVTDKTYTTEVLNTSGLVSLWPLREATGSTAYDSDGTANGTFTGGITQGEPSGLNNEPGQRSARFNGSTGYVTATNAALHPGDTWSLEFWFRKNADGSNQTVWSGGSGDIEVGFDSSNKLIVRLEGTGNHFVSDTAYTVTNNTTQRWKHVVITRSPGDTDVYVNGSAISGTTTARTFGSDSGAINIGRRKSGTDRYFNGWLQHVALYSSKLSAATVLAHYRAGAGVVVEGLELDSDAYDGREAVYVVGATGPGSGWVRPNQPIRTRFGAGGKLERQEIIVRDDAETKSKRLSYGSAFLKQNRDPSEGISFSITGFDAWRPAQVVSVDDDLLGLSAAEYEINHVETDVGMGSGVLTHTITAGKWMRSGARVLARRTRRRR